MNRRESGNGNEGERRMSRWDPNRDFAFARDPFDRLFRLANFMDDGFSSSSRASAPCIDIDEDEHGYEVTAELPGLKPDDVHVELDQGVLTISGEKRTGFDDDQRSQRRSRWSERSFGRFTRSFTLPSDADPDQLQASFSHGVLTVKVPKSEKSKPRTIDVASG
jgi:HSP20 family protein